MNIAFASGGKDSTAMIDILINNHPNVLDRVIFVAVEKEFPQECEFRLKLIERWNPYVHCEIIQTKTKFDDWFFGKTIRGNNKGKRRGFPPTLFPCYWTREAKIKPINNYLKGISNPIEFIGYTCDEKSKVRQNIKSKYLNGEIINKKYPLIDWNMTEDDCRDYCKKNGILNPLYKYFNRLGCFLCPKQSKKNIEILREYFPEQYDELRWYCSQINDEFIDSENFNINISLKEILK